MMHDLPTPFNYALFRFILGFAVGACFGSFGTMLAYRVPRGMSIITPGSHCPQCDTPLGLRDLVPLLSFLAGRGHCRYCHARIGMRYFWIELAVSVVGGLIGIFAVFL